MSRGDRRRLRQEIQYIFQDPYASLDPRKTVGFSIAEPSSSTVCSQERKAVAAAGAELLEQRRPAAAARASAIRTNSPAASASASASRGRWPATPSW